MIKKTMGARTASFDLPVFLKRDCIFILQFLAVKMKSQHRLIKIKIKKKRRREKKKKASPRHYRFHD